MLVEPVSDFAKIPQKCYQARKCTTVHTTHNSIKQVFYLSSLSERALLIKVKILKIGIHILCSHICRFNGASLHNICMRDIHLAD